MVQDNDLISRAELIQRIDKCVEANYVVTDPLMTIHDIKALISVLPAVDATPVVRCKDCRYYNTNYCGDEFGWCERNGIGHGTSDDWFCADGEK